jgi:hypothetical protein
MKSIVAISLASMLLLSFSACDLTEIGSTKLGGEESVMSKEGVELWSTSAVIAGVSDFSGSVTSYEDGISVYEGKAVVKNSYLKQLFSNIPEVKVVGDTLKTDNFQVKQTTNGMELLSGPTAGILVKYDSKVGDKYKTDTKGIERKVVSKSTDNDYPYAFFNIKVIEVEEPTVALKSGGVSKITYWANHRFGLVGIQFTFDDGTTAKFPVFCTEENQ